MPVGASLAAHGLADLAMYEGRWADAEKLLDDGIAADAKTKNTTSQAAKLIVLAEVHARSTALPQAVRAAQDAMQTLEGALDAAAGRARSPSAPAAAATRRPSRRSWRASFSAAAAPTARSLKASSRAPRAATFRRPEAFSRAAKLGDLWLGRFLLARTYIEAGQYPLAQAELDIAERRRLEAIGRVSRRRAVVPVSGADARTGPRGCSKVRILRAPPPRRATRSSSSLRPDTAALDTLAADARKRLAR